MEASSGGAECAVTAGPVGAQFFKPSVNLNKKGYAKLIEYMRGSIEDSDVSNIAVDTVTIGLRETLGFDAAAKRSEEYCKRDYENQKKLATKRGVSVYELSAKPRYERLKKEFPNLPTTMLSKSLKEITKAAATENVLSA